MNVVCQDLGTHQLKNIAQPVRVYRIELNEALRNSPRSMEKPTLAARAPPESEGPEPLSRRRRDLLLLADAESLRITAAWRGVGSSCNLSAPRRAYQDSAHSSPQRVLRRRAQTRRADSKRCAEWTEPGQRDKRRIEPRDPLMVEELADKDLHHES